MLIFIVASRTLNADATKPTLTTPGHSPSSADEFVTMREPL
jgi:hypothetical protein